MLLGDQASGLSPSAITRMVSAWSEERQAWKKRSLADRDYVYVWADGVHFGVRLDDERVAVLVTTDLHDELRGVPRYAALMGKAAILDVRIIPLEELGWDRLVSALSELWAERQSH